MKKIIIFSKDVYGDLDSQSRALFKKILEEFIEKGNGILFTSKDNLELNMIKKELNIHSDNIRFYSRQKLSEFINANKENSHYFIMVGNRDRDFTTAVNNKFLYLMPMWTKERYDKGCKYGIHINNLEVLKTFIETVNNQQNWFYELKLDNHTVVYSLISAHTMNGDISKQEKELVKGFQNFLKKGDITYYQILLYHFLAGIANNPIFKQVDLWGIIPSSGLELNKEMLEFKERARWCMKGGNPRSITRGEKENNIFLRKIKVQKSQYKSPEKRIQEGCSIHFDSIVINDAYTKSYLKNKTTACIFDDYLTNGNSFETARNLLKKLGFKNIILVSLGRFNKPYFKQDYELTGDLYSQGGYKYVLKSKKFIDKHTEKKEARKEVENLHKIFNL